MLDNEEYMTHSELVKEIKSEPHSKLISEKLKGKKLHSGVEIVKIPSEEWTRASGYDPLIVSIAGTAGAAVRTDLEGNPIQRYLVITEIDDGDIVGHEIGHTRKRDMKSYFRKGGKRLVDFVKGEVDADKWYFEKTGRPVKIANIISIANQISNKFNFPRDEAFGFVLPFYESEGISIDWGDLGKVFSR